MARSLAPAARPAAWASPTRFGIFLVDTAAIADAELRKVRHDPYELVQRAVQPVLWLVIFGSVMAATHAIPTGNLSYIDFLAPGILAQSALFSAIFYGITVVWERDLGIVQRYLVSPASRTALVAGKGLAAGLRALTQAFIVYIAAVLLGVHVIFDVFRIAGVGLAVILGSAAFAMFSLSIASLIKNRDRVMGFGQLMTMPLFFASSAIYPIALMPSWLQAIALVNPLTYMVSAIRALMVQPDLDLMSLAVDFGVLSLFVLVLLLIATRLYPRVAI
jgi:ABC-2 type transport system permease protein